MSNIAENSVKCCISCIELLRKYPTEKLACFSREGGCANYKFLLKELKEIEEIDKQMIAETKPPANSYDMIDCGIDILKSVKIEGCRNNRIRKQRIDYLEQFLACSSMEEIAKYALGKKSKGQYIQRYIDKLIRELAALMTDSEEQTAKVQSPLRFKIDLVILGRYSLDRYTKNRYRLPS